MDEKEFKDLLDRYSKNACSEHEEALLESWYLQEGRKRTPGGAADTDFAGVEQEIWHKLSVQAGWHKPQVIKPRFSILRWAAAASIVFTLALGYYLYNGRLSHKEGIVGREQSEVLPGSNKATLYLADGSAVVLDEGGSEELLAQAGLRISKLESGELLYTVSSAEQQTGSPTGFHSIKTPRGGQYQVVLADGTRVWLNAASSIRYPVVFTGDTREVELEGEAYFDVEKDPSRRFIVRTAKQAVAVLGTEFNVNAYADAPTVKTTLIEGSVALSSSKDASQPAVTLKPGQQATLSGQTFVVAAVDVEESIAWKNGYFFFEKEKLATALQKISRWYDIDVVYEERLPALEINGSVSRFDDVEKVLEVLRVATGKRFELEGRRLIVGK
ncbi:FecR family protein [Sphingobacterium griseoflavum]|uniref:Iron dicitrate transporter FecR n=1 Tax=Sphingobacterium griseoflavum TaxID=1474952 RepID=A0ABQ3HVU4_9SPHI|nr:FecR domain-containing protein [Sphingobacterium griseoflavum]GHE32789.1 iron dicitrate transporter FecR [Sphingobacterium griseoflavum]